MILSHNVRKEIKTLIAKRYGRSWIIKKVLQIFLAQTGFALLAFILYKIGKWLEMTGIEALSVLVFALLSATSILIYWSRYRYDKTYTKAQIEWLKTLKAEFIERRDKLNYGVLASMPHDQRIEECQRMIQSLEDNLWCST
ncbi:MAG: hypothetical protein KA007_01290 [Candidatus Pacebacteria bacterium]|nr:hypothetical protein [Candidatus Paceibacterota bacterium]